MALWSANIQLPLTFPQAKGNQKHPFASKKQFSLE